MLVAIHREASLTLYLFPCAHGTAPVTRNMVLPFRLPASHRLLRTDSRLQFLHDLID